MEVKFLLPNLKLLNKFTTVKPLVVLEELLGYMYQLTKCFNIEEITGKNEEEG